MSQDVNREPETKLGVQVFSINITVYGVMDDWCINNVTDCKQTLS